MKRVTERADLAEKQVPETISGCRQFEGEDLNYRNRINYHASIQKSWVNQQKDELEQLNNQLKKEEEDYAIQTQDITRFRGMLEDEMTIKKKQQLKELQEFNQRLAEEKRQREKNWKDTQESFNQAEITVYKDMVAGANPREIK